MSSSWKQDLYHPKTTLFVTRFFQKDETELFTVFKDFMSNAFFKPSFPLLQNRIIKPDNLPLPSHSPTGFAFEAYGMEF